MVFGSVTEALVAGLLAPIATTVCAVLISLPLRIAGWWLARRPRVRPTPDRLRSRAALSFPPAPGHTYSSRLHVQVRPPALNPRR